jgi:cephalosporin hydroxylase
VREMAKDKKTIMVSLDSNHTHEHVLEELKLYAPFVTVGSYCVVFDTIVEDMPKGMYDRPWDIGNNPKTAVWEYLKTNDDFEIDHQIDNKLLISVAPEGYLKKIK